MKGFQKQLLLFGLLLFFASCSSRNDKFLYKLQETVRHQVEETKSKNQRYSTFKMSNIVDFEWDKFYVFDEDITQEDISEILMIKWKGPQVSRGNKRILFIFDKKVVSYSDFDPSVFPAFFYTCEQTEQYEFSKKDDEFATFQTCDKNGCIFAVIPERCIGNFKRLYQQ